MAEPSLAPTSQASITRKLFDLAAPIIGINTLSVLMLAVDSALCGRLPNADHVLAAVGFSVQVVFLLMVAMMGLIVGTVALVARAHGGGDTARVDHVVRQSTTLTAIVGIVVGILGALLAHPILRAMGASHEVAEIGVDYLQPLMIGTPFWYLTLVYTGILRGVGNTRIPFACGIVANVVNAVLNYALVLGNFGFPQMGVTGSAIGTVIAQLTNLAILVWALKRGSVPGLRPSLRPAPIDRGLARELLKVGWPAAIDMLVINAGFLTALGMLGRIDEVTVAAHGLGLRIQSLAFIPGMSISQATGALVGQALGAGDIQRAKQVVRASILLCFVIMSALAAIIMLAGAPLTRVFNVAPGTPLETYSVQWMQLLGLAMFPSAFHIALVGLLQGSGATMTSLKINIWTTFVIQIPLSYVFGFTFGWGAWGVWLGFPFVFAAKAIFAYVAYRSEKWAVTGVRLSAGRR
ncbi:MAG: MATE family efflux transporter [Kofleriaceae bacterium]